MSKKNIARLTPVKKHVVDTRTNTPIERTYYIDPHTKVKKERTKKIEEPGSDQGIAAPNTDGVSGENKTQTPDASATDKNLVPKKKNEGLDLSSIKKFDDFGRQGVDPAVARQFFCNM